jgi:hypothetical protein
LRENVNLSQSLNKLIEDCIIMSCHWPESFPAFPMTNRVDDK